MVESVSRRMRKVAIVTIVQFNAIPIELSAPFCVLQGCVIRAKRIPRIKLDERCDRLRCEQPLGKYASRFRKPLPNRTTPPCGRFTVISRINFGLSGKALAAGISSAKPAASDLPLIP
ncbi:hypothetical protein Poly41_32820 [Novipirellula artificiosorum]|uniref:Uncharacterized protein n=1 Tax=Novipirellula artificiosorum TaxID=2528016 RepID=A0A5C6DLV8_9BACT|nr:hypothetical protein Poly41_32820 [Novipirellula artificiosorum]